MNTPKAVAAQTVVAEKLMLEQHVDLGLLVPTDLPHIVGLSANVDKQLEHRALSETATARAAGNKSLTRERSYKRRTY